MSPGRLALLLLSAAVAGHTQVIIATTATAPGTTGTVYGHVLCGDTSRPARMASVMLQPVVAASLPTSNASANKVDQPAPTPVVETLMDGSFTIPNVKPGDYYAIAELDGYVSALSLFSQDDLTHPTESMLQAMATLVKPVTVSPNSSSRIDVVLVRGGSISGTVLFEDGAPDIHSRVVLQRQFIPHGMKNYYTTMLNSPTVNTDDQGHYRFAGLPEGNYTVFAILSVKNMLGTDVSKWHGGTNLSASSTSTLSAYYGDTFRMNPKRITLKGAENSVANIQIQLSKLHSVSGTVVDAISGAPVNSGTVTIVWPKGADYGNDARVSQATIEEDGSFYFAFIPEGQFQLTASNLRQITMSSVTVSDNLDEADNRDARVAMFLRLQTAQNVAAAEYRSMMQGKIFADAQVPLIVQSDMTGVTVSASPQATPKTTASSH